jgi:hypothetical protein
MKNLKVGTVYICKVKRYLTGEIRHIDMIYSPEDDLCWRFEEDGSEFNEIAYDVIEAIEKEI